MPDLWPEWVKAAACRGRDPELFFEKGVASNTERRICASCPVRSDCQEWSLTLPGVTDGILGGLTKNQRNRWRLRGGEPPRIHFIPEPVEPRQHYDVSGRRSANGEKTHCKYGHEFNEENTVVYRGRRNCTRCARRRARERYAAERHPGVAA